MQVNFVLVATGSVILKKINHIVLSATQEDAIRQSSEMAAILFSAGYFVFTLYDVSDNNGHKIVAAVTVEQTAPTVKIIQPEA